MSHRYERLHEPEEGEIGQRKWIASLGGPEAMEMQATSQNKSQSEPAGLPKVSPHRDTTALDNPLARKTRDQLQADVRSYLQKTGLESHEHGHLFYKGALVAQRNNTNDDVKDLGLTTAEMAALENERRNKWSQTRMLYAEAFLVSMAAVVQGMDETVINGANLYYPTQFGIGSDSKHDVLLLGLVNSAPYLCSAVFSCWLTYPLNKYFGRRGALFISTTCAFLGCIWNACTSSWVHLFISRLFLGIGIGPKSATAPILVAEVAPARIRGALAINWQSWTAFGIMLGTVSSLLFEDVSDRSGIVGLNWRLMLGSAALPAIIVMVQIWFVPESPRWLITKGRHIEAFESMLKLRKHPIIAARDLYYTNALIEDEQQATSHSENGFLDLFRVPRNRRAFYASSIVMFGQQFCGVNAIAYYSSTIFKNAGSTNTEALLGSFGTGVLNFLFAWPAFFTIDTFGRRWLLLVTFPFLALFMAIAGFGFLLSNPRSQLAMVTTGMYLFEVAYSPGVGPVPFCYAAEAYPITVREFGMALATATTWLFNFIVALTYPLLVVAFVSLVPSTYRATYHLVQTSFGSFIWFAVWNVVLWFLVLLFLPETKELTLEELDKVFSVPTRRQALYGAQTPLYELRRLLGKPAYRRPLYDSGTVVTRLSSQGRLDDEVDAEKALAASNVLDEDDKPLPPVQSIASPMNTDWDPEVQHESASLIISWERAMDAPCSKAGIGAPCLFQQTRCQRHFLSTYPLVNVRLQLSRAIRQAV